MACQLTSAVDSSSAAWSQHSSGRRAARTTAERLAIFGIIGALHLIAIQGIWTRQLILEPEPAPLLVTPLEPIVQELQRPAPVVPSMIAPPVVLAPPLPPSIELIEAAPTAIIAKEVPPELPPVTPTTTVSSSTITEARFDVDYLNNPAPVYPPLSRKLREEGVVVLKVLVRSDGSVADATFNQRSGSARLDEAALSAVKRWHFVPARRGDEPIESWVFVPIEFELQT